MRFSTTYFYNFRNLNRQRAEWPEGFNLITGPNGAGKTNFLEGLNLISGWGPIERGGRVVDTIRWNGSGHGERASLWAKTDGEEVADLFASISTRCQLKYGDRPAIASTMRSRVPVLSFLSSTMSLLRGGAAHRRQLIDRVGALVSPVYAKHLSDYRRILRQKAVLLRRGGDVRVADKVICPLGSWIWSAREEIVVSLVAAMPPFANLLSRGMEMCFVRGGGGNVSDSEGDFRDSLIRSRDRERASRIPLVGPQRDDLVLTCDGRPALNVLSRGQSRRAASALILAAATFVREKLSREPVLIFDEFTSELDESGKNALIEALLSTGFQIFAAAADEIVYDGVTTHRICGGRFL